jgi:hypothetical protein
MKKKPIDILENIFVLILINLVTLGIQTAKVFIILGICKSIKIRMMNQSELFLPNCDKVQSEQNFHQK